MSGHVLAECSDCGNEFEQSRPNNLLCDLCRGYKRPGGRARPVNPAGCKTRNR